METWMKNLIPVLMIIFSWILVLVIWGNVRKEPINEEVRKRVLRNLIFIGLVVTAGIIASFWLE